MSQVTLKVVYYACFHSVTNYVLIFGRNSLQRAKIIKLQQNIIRIITGCSHRKIFMEESKNSTT